MAPALQEITACMVLFAIIYRNLRIKIKQEKNDDAPPSPRGPWLRGLWIKLWPSYESLTAALEAFDRFELGSTGV